MPKDLNELPCQRIRHSFGEDEHYYVLRADDFLSITIPYENQIQNQTVRQKVDLFCEEGEGMIVRLMKSDRSFSIKEGELYRATKFNEKKVLLLERLKDGFEPRCTQKNEEIRVIVERVK